MGSRVPATVACTSAAACGNGLMAHQHPPQADPTAGLTAAGAPVYGFRPTTGHLMEKVGDMKDTGAGSTAGA